MDPPGGDRLAASVPEESYEAVTEKNQNLRENLDQGRAEVGTVSKSSLETQSVPLLALQQVGFGTVTEWLDGAIIETTKNVDGQASQASTGFAWSLYHHTLELFSHLYPLALPLSVPGRKRQHEKSFKKSLGRLFLWGDGFRDGKLESVLDHSDSLRETIIESLCAIGKILLHSKWPIRIIPSMPWAN
jgi:hypothetical protein